MFAFLIYGAWAAFVNIEYGPIIMIRSGLGQGVYAFFSTWLVTLVARKVMAAQRSTLTGMINSFLAALITMLVFPLTIHQLLKTPDVLEAILPGLIWGSSYILVVISLSSNPGLRVSRDSTELK